MTQRRDPNSPAKVSSRRWKASVTLEYTEQAPETVRTEIVASSASTAASRAISAARRQLPGRRFASLSLLLEPL